MPAIKLLRIYWRLIVGGALVAASFGLLAVAWELNDDRSAALSAAAVEPTMIGMALIGSHWIERRYKLLVADVVRQVREQGDQIVMETAAAASDGIDAVLGKDSRWRRELLDEAIGSASEWREISVTAMHGQLLQVVQECNQLKQQVAELQRDTRHRDGA